LLGVLILAAPAWVMADRLGAFLLHPTDFIYIEQAIDSHELRSRLFEPLNTHVVPLFRLYTFGVVRATSRLEDLPRKLLFASYLGLVATMIGVCLLVSEETGKTGIALGAMAATGITSVLLPVLDHYAASQALWSGAAIVATLLATAAWRKKGGVWRLVLAGLGVIAAPAVWSGGLAAGPAAAAGLWADGRPRRRLAAIALLGLAVAAAIAILLLTRQYIKEDMVVNETHAELWPRPIQGTLNAVQAVAEATILNNLGIDAATTAFQATVMLGIVACLWYVSRRRKGRLTPLEASGAVFVLSSTLLVYLFRGNLSFDSLRPVGWYYALPHIGAVLFVAGWWSALEGSEPETERALTVRGTLCVLLLAATLGGVHSERATRLLIDGSPPLAPSELSLFPTSQLRRLRAVFLRDQDAEDLRRVLVRLDHVEQIARRRSIGKGAIRRTFGRVLMPGIPKKHTADAASLLRVHEEDTRQSASFVREALGDWYKPEPPSRPPWLQPPDRWPPG
jgi:hypothetical protein